MSKQARLQLMKLKRATGIGRWHELCRWAFCVSLAEKGVPTPRRIAADSNIEMSWQEFGGRHSELYLALLKERCAQDRLGTGEDVLERQFKLHLHRGISYLAENRNLRDIDDLIRLPLQAE